MAAPQPVGGTFEVEGSSDGGPDPSGDVLGGDLAPQIFGRGIWVG